nr:hypothetical protein [Desulfobacteraceae bacterium]
MSGQEISVIKLFKFAFVLDRPKLSRILTILDTRFKEVIDKPFVNYDTMLANGKAISAPEIESILAHDNSVKNPIDNLSILYKDKEQDAEHVCKLVFDRDDSDIMMQIRSPNGRFANELYAEIEEQIERTQVHKTIYSLKEGSAYRMVAVAILTVLSVIVAAFSPSMKNLQSNNFLKDQDLKQLSALASTATDQAGKANFIYEMHRLQLTNTEKASAKAFPVRADLRLAFVLVPSLILTRQINVAIQDRMCYISIHGKNRHEKTQTRSSPAVK